MLKDIRHDYTKNYPEPRVTARSGDAPDTDPSNIKLRAPASEMPKGVRMPTGREPGCLPFFTLIRKTS